MEGREFVLKMPVTPMHEGIPQHTGAPKPPSCQNPKNPHPQP